MGTPPEKMRVGNKPTAAIYANPTPFFARGDELVVDVDGLKITCQAWGIASSDNKILCVHGFQDNSNTWHKIIPKLAETAKAYIVAMDLPGHGRSDRFSKINMYHLIDHVMVVSMVADTLGWEEFGILSHSMGGVISSTLAGGLGERVTRLCMLDIFGPPGIPPELTALQLRRGLADRRTLTMRAPRIFPSVEVASKLRAGLPPDKDAPTVGMRAGATYRIGPIDYESARSLMTRGMKKVGDIGVGEQNGNGVMVTQDPKMTASALMTYSDEQSLDLLRAIKAPTLTILAKQGMVVGGGGVALPYNIVDRIEAVKGVDARFVFVEGRHHVHVDDPTEMLPFILEFFSSKKGPLPAEFTQKTLSCQDFINHIETAKKNQAAEKSAAKSKL